HEPRGARRCVADNPDARGRPARLAQRCTLCLNRNVARLFQRVVEDPRPCTYLPGVEAQLEVRLMLDVSPEELDQLLERGWRPLGPVYFRPLCRRCDECRTLRIPVAGFRPGRNQRRAARRAARFRRVVGPPRVDTQRLALYTRWHADREQ